MDLIIAVGYQVNSKQRTAFRIWANKIIKDHLVKGYTINEKRLLELQKIIKLVNRTIQLIRLKKTDFKFTVQKSTLG